MSRLLLRPAKRSVGRGVYAVMALSLVLIGAGITLVAIGWVTVYRGRHRLVTEGPYRFVRHPQYLGLILIVLGFNVMRPTLLTLVMAPVLIVMYGRLARQEDEDLATVFGEAFLRYAARTPAFVPWGRRGVVWGPGLRAPADAGVRHEPPPPADMGA